jgi:hypothetical protein
LEVPYSPPKSIILHNKTIAYVVVKLNLLSAGGPVLLEAWHIAPFPGDPTSKEYSFYIPDFLRLIVVGLGVVGDGHNSLPGGAVTFPVMVSDFVHGGVKETSVRCVFIVLV